jgi:hypothetical protein
MCDLPDQFILQRTADAVCYHTGYCLAVKRTSPEEASPISDRTINWHELRLCDYCSGDAPNTMEAADD